MKRWKGSKKTLPVDYKMLTDRIREHLRSCRCLIFAFSAKSRASRWMPWELGFFDGRWGRRLIGLYDLDEGAKENATQPVQSSGEVGMPEFLQITASRSRQHLKVFCSTCVLHVHWRTARTLTSIDGQISSPASCGIRLTFRSTRCNSGYPTSRHSGGVRLGFLASI